MGQEYDGHGCGNDVGVGGNDETAAAEGVFDQA